MRSSFLIGVILLGACGGQEEAPNAANGADIARLATPRQEAKADPLASVRLQSLTAADLEQEGLAGAGCEFRLGDMIVLAAAGSDALIRINGELRHLVHSAPSGATGGFFEDRRLSVSIGRTEGEGDTQATGTWPARLTVTNRRTEVDLELRGSWSCRG
jgi:hypothetical protein